MIRYSITKSELHAAITSTDANWFDRTAAVLAALPANPSSDDFKSHWSAIKQVYINLQNEKCCFCEKPLEGKIEQDVEHFRPKSEVKPWKVPGKLLVEGVVVNQPADGSSEPGYTQLAYEPFNYAMACKTCNSTLKKNFFPIEGVRDSKNADPSSMGGERVLLIYPIGTVDANPASLIAFDALSPIPVAASGISRRRALVTIEIFRLDDSVTRRALFKQRAVLVRLLYHELEGFSNAKTPEKRAKHQKAIQGLVSPKSPFTNCLLSFQKLYQTDPAKAETIADECLKFIDSKSLGKDGK